MEIWKLPRKTFHSLSLLLQFIAKPRPRSGECFGVVCLCSVWILRICFEPVCVSVHLPLPGVDSVHLPRSDDISRVMQ